jgi:glycosyltransferase involved in cell wall biosynthesis
MKICLIATPLQPVPVQTWGGIECQAQAHAQGLAALGHEVHLLTVGDPAAPVPCAEGIAYHRIAAPPAASASPLAALAATLRFGWRAHRVLREIQPDVAHFHARYPCWLNLLLDILRPPSWRVLYHAHNWKAAEQMPFARFGKRWLAAQLGRRLDRSIARRCDQIVTISEFMKSRIVATAGIDPGRVAVVTNVVDPALFAPRPAEAAPSADPQILFIGRVAEEKGVLPLIDALAAIRRAIPGARLKIVGPDRSGSELGQHMARCLVRVQELGLSEAVDFMGALPNHRLPELLRQSRVLAVPSVWGEPLGVVVLEGLACGLPVVASAVGGIPELIEPEKTGLLVPPADAEALALALIRALGDAALSASAAVEGPRRVAARHVAPVVAAQLAEIHEATLRRPAAVPFDAPTAAATPPAAGPDGRIRIFMLSSSTAGGTGIHAASLARALDRSRFDLTIGFGPGYPLDAEIATLGVPVVHFSIRRSLAPLANLRGFLQVLRFLRRNRFDILCVSNAMGSAIGRVAAWLTGVPATVLVIHAFASHPHQPAPKRVFYRLLERALAPLTTHFVAVSRSIRDFGARARIVNAQRASVILNGIEPPSDAAIAALESGRDALRRELNLSPDGVVVATCARFERQKGLCHLIDAAARILSPHPGVHFLIVGEGPLDAQLRDQAARLGLTGLVHFPGWRTDIPQILSASDIVCMPSLWEAMPFSLLVGMALGRPMVASRIDGIDEVIEDGVSGLLVPPADPAALAAAIESLLTDPARRAEMGRRARARILDGFTIGPMVRAYESLFDRMAKRARRPARAQTSPRGWLSPTRPADQQD